MAVSEKYRKKISAHVVTLPQGVCHGLGIRHLRHHLVEPVKKLSERLFVSSWSIYLVSHAKLKLGLFRRLDIGHFVLFELFCLQRGATNTCFYCTKTINAESLENSLELSDTVQHSFIGGCTDHSIYFVQKYVKTNRVPWERHLLRIGLRSTPLISFFSSHFPLFFPLLLLRRCFSFMFSVTVKGFRSLLKIFPLL